MSSNLVLVEDFFPANITNKLLTIVKKHNNDLSKPPGFAPDGRAEINLLDNWILTDIGNFVKDNSIAKVKDYRLEYASLFIDNKDFFIPLHKDSSHGKLEDGVTDVCDPWKVQIQIYLNNKRNPGIMFFDDATIKHYPSVVSVGSHEPENSTVVWYMSESEIDEDNFCPDTDFHIDNLLTVNKRLAEHNVPPIKEVKYGYNNGYISYTANRIAHTVPKIVDSVGDRVSITFKYN